jgi:Pyruvate/2-oxoacid:ferredoxin oxidoreductase delta subunit
MTTPTPNTQTLIPALLTHAAKLPPGPYIEDRYQIVVDLDDDSVTVLDRPEYALLPILKTTRGGNSSGCRVWCMDDCCSSVDWHSTGRRCTGCGICHELDGV